MKVSKTAPSFQKDRNHLAVLHWVTQLWNGFFFFFLDDNKQPLSFIGRDDMKKTRYVHRM